MFTAARIIDISLAIGTQAPAWPGDPPLEVRPAHTFATSGWHTSVLTMSAHAGTHIDAPGHILPGAPLLDAFGLERFILPAVVVDAGPGPLAGAEAVRRSGLRPGEALLVRTDNSARGLADASGAMRTDFTALSPEAARACVDAGASLVGIDAPSVDPYGGPVPAHETLMRAGVLVMEWLALAAAPPGRHLLVCLPLHLPGVEASPVRAVLLEGAAG